MAKTSDVANIRLAINEIMSGNLSLPPRIDLSDLDSGEVSGIIHRLSKLTPQQMRVLMMLSEGLLSEQITVELSVSEATIKAHVSAILQNSESRIAHRR